MIFNRDGKNSSGGGGGYRARGIHLQCTLKSDPMQRERDRENESARKILLTTAELERRWQK
jgi:hypothetical protein